VRLLIKQEGENDASVMFSDRLSHAIDSLVDDSVISHMIFRRQIHHPYHHYQQYQQAIRIPFHTT